MKNIKIYTIGYSNRDFNSFLEILRYYKINVLIDIRRFPTSKFEWFKRDFLEEELPKNGINYMCFKELGALGLSKKVKPLEDLTCIDSLTFRAYITYLLTDNIVKEKIKRILELSTKSITCLMCKEYLPWKCHRWYLSDFLLISGIKVIHILDEKRTIEHKGSRCFNYIKKLTKRFFSNVDSKDFR